MYMRMPVETTAIRVDGAEDTGFQPRFRAAYSRFSTARRRTSFSSQRLLSNTSHSVSGRVKPDVPSRSQEDDSAVLLSTGLWPSFRRTGRHGCRMSWSGTLRADGPGYHAELFYTQYPCAAEWHLVTASASISRRPPASGKDVQHWLAVNRRFRGRGVKPDNMRMD